MKPFIENNAQYDYKKLSIIDIASHGFFLIPSSLIIGAMSFSPNFPFVISAYRQLFILDMSYMAITDIFSDSASLDNYYKEALKNPCQVTIVAPILEEIIFRMLIQNSAFYLFSFFTSPQVALTCSSVSSALIFASVHLIDFEKFDLLHMSAKFSFCFTSGMMFSNLKNNFGLPASIALHILHNTVSMCVLKFQHFFRKEPPPGLTHA